jgi:hypothetical protein
MATSENNLLLKNLSGHIGKQVVIKQYGNKTVMSKYPDMSKRKLSAKQKQVNRNMEAANDFAKTIMADDAERNATQLRLNVTSNKLYTALIREYFKNIREADQNAAGKKKK